MLSRKEIKERLVTKALIRWIIGTPTERLIRDAIELGFERGVRYGKEEKEIRKET